MFDNMQVLESKEGNVWKYIFERKDAIAEAVLYKHESFEKRAVICCSVMSGCPVGCSFCGTGKEFIRNLTDDEIVEQIRKVLRDKNIEDINSRSEKFQIMFMSMGEPMLNWGNVKNAILRLNEFYPNADLLISTVGIANDVTFNSIINLSKRIDKIGLQFSIHRGFDRERNQLIPFKQKMNLRRIRDAGIVWNRLTSRKVYCNYVVTDKNQGIREINKLKDLFSPTVFNFTFSVLCQADKDKQNQKRETVNEIKNIHDCFISEGYNSRIFNPAGQDDIGGGCGQLWYVQQWLKNN